MPISRSDIIIISVARLVGVLYTVWFLSRPEYVHSIYLFRGKVMHASREQRMLLHLELEISLFSMNRGFS